MNVYGDLIWLMTVQLTLPIQEPLTCYFFCFNLGSNLKKTKKSFFALENNRIIVMSMTLAQDSPNVDSRPEELL